MISRKPFLIVTLLLMQAVAIAQTPQVDWVTQLASMEFKARRVIPPAPEAASLGKYGNVPLSLFTGTPSVSVPLYQLAGNNLSLPIQLSYNAGGFNPQEIAGWVGLGWSLSAGGVVTRSVNGNPDDATNYFKTPSPLVVPNVNADPYAYYEYMEELRKGNLDAQPDVYYYNFAGRSGKFYVKPDNSILKREKNDLQITAAVSAPVAQVVIIDEKGTRYEFSDCEVASLQQDDIGQDVPMHTYTYASSMYLTRITSADGFEEISFTYYTTNDQYLFNNYYANESAVYTSVQPVTGNVTMTGPVLKVSTPATVKTKRKYLQQISLKRAGVLVSYINFESVADQRLDLEHNPLIGYPGERLLNSIKVYAKKNGTSFGLVKQHNFTYSYFTNSGNAATTAKRLRLDNVQEIAVNPSAGNPPPYTFTYNDNGLMPDMTTTQMDHWGFYNMSGSNHLYPDHLVNNGNFIVTAANRAPNLSGSSAFLINKITYPTGGYTTFEYELNKAKDANNPAGPSIDIGGVRIKKMTDYSFLGKKATERTYEYLLEDNTTSGKAIVPSYESYSVNKNYAPTPTGASGWMNYCASLLSSTQYTTSFSANGVIGLGTIQGSHIGYSRVIEMLTDPANAQPLGKTVYNYFTSGEWNPKDDYLGNGDLIKKSIYDNSGKLVSEETNEYTINTLGSIGAAVPSVAQMQDNQSFLNKFNSPTNGVYYAWQMSTQCDPYQVDSRVYKSKYTNGGWVGTYRDKQLTQQVFRQYDQKSNSYLTITRKFTYGNPAHTLATKIEQSTSNGDWVVTEKKYPLDYTIPGTGTLDANTAGIKLQKDKNIVGAEVESYQYRQNSLGANKRYVAGSITTYNDLIPYPKQIYRLELAAPLTALTASSTTAGNFVFDGNYKLAGFLNLNSNGTLREQGKNQDVVSAYVWDFDYQYPTAEIVNAQLDQIAYTSFESDGTGEWSTIPALATQRVANSGVTGKNAYSLVPGNNITKNALPTTRQYVVSYWSNNGPVSVSTTGGAGTLNTGDAHNGWTYYEHILPAGISAVTLSAAASRLIDELRLYPLDAQMTSVTFDPGVGMTAQNSPKNEISSFEYDGLSRLVNARDEDQNIIKNLKYNFGTDFTPPAPSAQTLFYNAVKQQAYVKQGCPVGSEGTSVIYTVPYGKYIGLNQLDADNKATADNNANGQAYANANGLCLYWNTAQSQYFSKNDCGPTQGTSICSTTAPLRERYRTLYTVPAHVYSSAVDLTTANNLALADIAANGQNYANTVCWCSCAAEGQKFINNVCETGTRYNSSSTYIGNGQYQCIYYYQFSDGSVSQFYSQVTTSPCPVF